jgi:hypothetical protein
LKTSPLPSPSPLCHSNQCYSYDGGALLYGPSPRPLTLSPAATATGWEALGDETFRCPLVVRMGKDEVEESVTVAFSRRVLQLGGREDRILETSILSHAFQV